MIMMKEQTDDYNGNFISTTAHVARGELVLLKQLSSSTSPHLPTLVAPSQVNARSLNNGDGDVWRVSLPSSARLV